MPDLFFERHVPHRPELMYGLVANLSDYPSFVPNCRAMSVQPDPVAGQNTQYAKMTISFGPVTQAYTSKVKLDPKERTITAKAMDGPFAYLDSQWRFDPEGQGTRVRFDIDFKISNPLIATLAEPAFARKQDEIIQAFIDEADRRYGR